MTEAEWHASEDAQRMIQVIGHTVWGERRGRLFAVACSRMLVIPPDDRLATLIGIAERFADGQADDVELSEAIGIANEVVEWEARHDMTSWRSHAAEVVAAAVRFPTEEYVAIDEYAAWARTEQQEADKTQSAPDCAKRTLANLVREIAGNPYRSVSFCSEWRTSTAVSLARQMYVGRDFSAMPILADALQDAGCGDAEILDHCRGPEPHVRGCWVVDLLLGK